MDHHRLLRRSHERNFTHRQLCLLSTSRRLFAWHHLTQLLELLAKHHVCLRKCGHKSLAANLQALHHCSSHDRLDLWWTVCQFQWSHCPFDWCCFAGQQRVRRVGKYRFASGSGHRVDVNNAVEGLSILVYTFWLFSYLDGPQKQVLGGILAFTYLCGYVFGLTE